MKQYEEPKLILVTVEWQAILTISNGGTGASGGSGNFNDWLNQSSQTSF